MRFWFARDSEVSIREQLVTQVVLCIVSGEIEAGHRLPSTRELARRFHIHANTISAGYKQLERDGWVEFRHGSGVYVLEKKPDSSDGQALALDALIARFFSSAREIGMPMAEVRRRLQRWLSMQPPDRFMVIDPDEELRKILIAEIERAVPFPVYGCGLEELRESGELVGSIPVVLPSKKQTVKHMLPSGTDLIVLKVRSVPESLAGYLPAPTDLLIGVASRWPEFLKSSRTMLIAAGFHPDSLVLRDARTPAWTQGLKQTSAVVCDCICATTLPKGCRAIVFSIIAEEALEELRRYCSLLSEPGA